MPVVLPHRLLTALLVVAAASFTLSPASSAQSSDSGVALDRALARVDTMRAAGNFRNALSRLEALRDEHGDDADILWRLSFTHIDIAKTLDGKDARKPKYNKALSMADAGLSADTANAHAHLAKAIAEGRIALDAGTQERVRRSRAVKTHADRAIELDSTLDGAYHTRARWNRGVADLGFFSRAVVKTVYGGLPDASFEQAVRDFKRAIELHDERLHHLELAKTYLKMDREIDARRELMRVTEMPAEEPFDPQYKEEAQELLDDLD